MTAADHLNLDAVVAFADGEMSMVSYQRAAAHVARCPQCDAEVKAQVVARSWLRSAGTPTMPTSLLDTLRSIPVAAPLDPDQRGGSGRHDATPRPSTFPAAHPRSAHRSRRFRFLGAGALVAGLTVGVLVGSEVVPEPGGPPEAPHVALSPMQTSQVAPAGFGTP